MGNKDNCVLNRTAPVPWPSPLTRVVSLDSLSPVLSLAVGYGSWQTPLSWSHHLSPHWTSLWARDSAQSSRARVTSSYSHCELSLPSAGDQISGLDHFVDGSEFRTRDLQIADYISQYVKTAFSAVIKSRFAPGSPSWVFVCLSDELMKINVGY